MIQGVLILILIFAPIARGAARVWAFGPIQLLVLLLGLFCIFRMFSEREIKIKRTPLDIPILSFFFVFIIASFNSGYIYATLTEFIRLASLAAVFYIVVNFINKENEIKRLLDVALMVSTGIALFGILQYLGALDRSWWDSPRFLSATYINHNHFAGLMELSIPLCLGMILSEKETGKKMMYVYSFLVLSIAFLLSLSRGGWLSLTVAMIFMFAAIFKKGKTRVAFFIVILLLITLGLFIFNTGYVDLLFKRISSYGELDLSGRALIWKGTIGIIKDNWLLGTGPGSFIYNFPRYRVASLNRFVNFAHNDYLQVSSEMGVFGLALMVIIIGLIITKGLKTYNVAKMSFKRWTSLSLSTAVLSLSLHGLGDFNFYIPANAILFTVFSALIFNISSRREKERPPLILKPNPVFKVFISLGVITLLIFIATSLAAEICITKAERALSKNELERAEGMARSATRLCPFNHMYTYTLAGIYHKKADIREAEKGYKEAVQLNPLDAWSWIGLADTYSEILKLSPIDEGISESAVSAYTKALDLDPLNSYYLKKFAEFLLNTGDARLSSQMYKKASYVMSSCEVPLVLIERFTDGEYYLDAAGLALSSQDYNRALVFYKMAEEFLKSKGPAQLGQLRCHMKMSSMPEAFNKFREMESSGKTGSVLFAALSDYYLRKGAVATAKRFSEKSILSDPENPEGYQMRYKLAKRLNAGVHLSKEISDILAFNDIPVALDLKGRDFELEFKVEKGLHSEGALNVNLILPAGIYEFNVKARGKAALDIWPHMEVRFNDKRSMDSYVDSESWDLYPGIIVAEHPVNRFDIVYDNDYYDEENMEDRNLYVDSIRLRVLP